MLPIKANAVVYSLESDCADDTSECGVISLAECDAERKDFTRLLSADTKKAPRRRTSAAVSKLSYLSAASTGLRRRGQTVESVVSHLHPKASIAQPMLHASEFAGEASIFACVVSLTNTCIGAGILGLPYAISKLGLLLGTVTLCIVCVFTGVMVFLAMAASKTMTEGTTFSDIGWKTFPNVMKVIDAMNAFGNLGTCSAYLVIVGDNGPRALKHIVEQFGGNADSVFLKREAVIAIFSIVMLLPVIRERHLGNMKIVSIFAIAGFLCILSVTFMSAVVPSMRSHVRGNAPEEYGFDSWYLLPHSDATTFLSVLPIVVLGFNCAFNAIPLTHELKDNSFKRVSVVIGCTMLNCLAVYSVVGVSVYYTFGRVVQSDFLLNYPTDSWTFTAVRLVYAITVCLSYPVVMYTVRESLSFIILKRGAIDARTTAVQFYALTYGIFAITFIVAMITKDLGIVMALAGLTSAIAATFFVPGLAFYYRCTPMGGPLYYSPAPGSSSLLRDASSHGSFDSDPLSKSGRMIMSPQPRTESPSISSEYGAAQAANRLVSDEMWNVWPNWMRRLGLFAVGLGIILVPLFGAVQFV